MTDERPSGMGKTKSQGEDLPLPSDQAAINYGIWGKAFLAGLILVAPPVVIGLLREVNQIEAEELAESWSLQVLLQVFLPSFITWIAMTVVCGRLVTIFGFGMLKESSKDIELKSAISTNMTSLGVMLALFLTVLLSMLLEAAPGGDFVRDDLWYLVFLIFGTESCVRGLIMTVLFLVYNEPLTEDAARSFAVDNMLYLGEPTTCLIATLIYFLWACALQVFSAGGKWLGMLSACALGYVVIRAMVVAQYLGSWKNPELDDDTRKNRGLILKAARAVDGSG